MVWWYIHNGKCDKFSSKPNKSQLKLSWDHGLKLSPYLNGKMNQNSNNVQLSFFVSVFNVQTFHLTKKTTLICCCFAFFHKFYLLHKFYSLNLCIFGSIVLQLFSIWWGLTFLKSSKMKTFSIWYLNLKSK